MRKTKIVCTLGPASESEEMLKKMLEAGMNVARFNFSHGTREEQGERLKRLRKVAKELDTTVAALMDTKGPEIRLRDFEGGAVMLEPGEQFILTTDEVMGTAKRASITYKGLKDDIKEGMSLLINDGVIELRVDRIEGTEIICTVIAGGKVSNHKGINAPGATLSMPYINSVDEADIRFAARAGYDFIACSFVRCAEDILKVRKILKEENSRMKIISKIENMQGIDNLDEIIEVSDGVMVARGDMGVEIPMEQVPILQKDMIKKTVAQGKHVITATQMLESMIVNPRPTRAEVTDIANAIYDGTTAIMLSGETAAGKYPVEAIQAMDRIAIATEKTINYVGRMRNISEEGTLDITSAISHATCQTAFDIDAAAIITVTMSGFTAEKISRYKPVAPIIACSTTIEVCRQMNMLYGVKPILIKEDDTSTEHLFQMAIAAAKRNGYVKAGDKVVLTAGLPLGVSGNTNMIEVSIID